MQPAYSVQWLMDITYYDDYLPTTIIAALSVAMFVAQ